MIEFDKPSPSLNKVLSWQYDRRSRWTYANLKSKIQGELERSLFANMAEWKLEMGGHPMTRPAHVVFERESAGQLDHDNLVGGLKCYVDAMVKAGMLVDDTAEWVTIEYKQKKCPRGQGGLVVTISRRA